MAQSSRANFGLLHPPWSLRLPVAAQVITRVRVTIEKPLHPRTQVLLLNRMCWLVDEVVPLARIVLQIVELIRAIGKTPDVLPLGCADYPSVLKLKEHDIIPLLMRAKERCGIASSGQARLLRRLTF